MSETLNDTIGALEAKLSRYAQIRHRPVAGGFEIDSPNDGGFKIGLHRSSDRWIVTFGDGFHEEFADPSDALDLVAFGLSDRCRLREVQGKFERTLNANLSGTESEVRRCVVRTDGGDLEHFGLLSRRLWFSGLRRIQIEGADGMIYVAADEPCPLLTRFVLRALNTLEIADPRLISCGEASFRTCGYPDVISGR